jgi:ribonuclease-3
MDEQFFGYSFKNENWLTEALTTPSCKMSSPKVKDNQRLEFLGDAIIGFLAAEQLFKMSEESREGDLTERRSRMVSTYALCSAAKRIGLVKYLLVNRGAHEGDVSQKMLADSVEALIGAAFMDGGLDAARKIYEKLDLYKHSQRDEFETNPKGVLQIMSQSCCPPSRPEYKVKSVTGPSHAPVFEVVVSVPCFGSAEGRGGSRKDAEANAAYSLLASLKRKDVKNV